MFKIGKSTKVSVLLLVSEKLEANIKVFLKLLLNDSSDSSEFVVLFGGNCDALDEPTLSFESQTSEFFTCDLYNIKFIVSLRK